MGLSVAGPEKDVWYRKILKFTPPEANLNLVVHVQAEVAKFERSV